MTEANGLKVTEPLKAGEPARADGCTNVFSEFVASAYQSAIQRPVDSIKQLAGVKVEQAPEVQLTGAMKVSNVVGSATGQILDFLVLNKIAGRAIKGAVTASGEASAAARVLAEGTLTRAAATSGTVGFVNGALLTPVQDNEGLSRRMANGLVDAGSFATMGVTGAKFAGSFGDTLLGRAKLSALSGVAGGAVNSVLDPASHGRLPDLKEAAVNTASWAVGSVIAGEALRTAGQGLDLVTKGIQSQRALPVDSTMPTEPTRSAEPKPAEPTKSAEQIKAAEPLKPEIAEKVIPTDATSDSGKTRPPLDMLSMRELAEKGDIDALNERLKVYYPELQKAFPLPGEIEDPQTYIDYLTDRNFPWEMEQLIDKDGSVKGGLQYQILDVKGQQVNKAGWLEHIWVKDGSRAEGFGSALLDHVQTQIQKKGGDLTMWEFNDPDKMTPEEISEDAKGGITTQDRVDYWAKRGAYVLKVPSTGELAAYAQPGMDGQEPVTYLSTAWNAPGGLDGVKLPVDDYKKTLLAAHSTIVDVDADPTVKEYLDNLNSLPDTHLEFVKLSDYLAQRAQQLDIDHLNGDPNAQMRRDRWIGADSAVQRGAVLLDVADVPSANPEVTRAQEFQDRSSASAPWNRTAPVVQRFNSFEGDTDADVVVVGGGVVGLQTAHELGSHGMKTIVLDKGLVGSGTSRFMGAMGTYAEDAGFGGILQAHGEEGFSRRLQALLESRASVQQLAQRYGADWRDVHSYNVSYDANDPALQEEVDLLHRFGDMAPRFVTGEAAARIFAPAGSIAIFPNEGNLNPYKLSLGLANSGKFAVYENSPVLGIAVGAPGDGVDVFSPGGTIHAKKVVFATNGPAPMFSDLNQHLVPVQCFATVADIGQKLPGNFFDTDSTAFTYWRQFGVKPFGPTETLIGGTARFLNDDTAAPDSPRLNARVSELFSGARARDPITALIFTAYSDGIPVAGPHPKYPDIWSATGAGGTGLVNGNWMARTIRQQLMATGDENLISPTRFQSLAH